MEVPTLYDKCISNITRSFKNCTKFNTLFANIQNPFSDLPSSVINDLMKAVVHHYEYEPNVEYLYYLLTSGHLEHFKLEKGCVFAEDFLLILKSLAPSSQSLKSLTLNVYVADPEYPDLEYFLAQALQTVLQNSPKLEYIESRISFDLEMLQKCPKLKTIKLNPTLVRYLNGLIDAEWKLLFFNYLENFPFFQNEYPFQALIPILSSCSELTYINCDLSQVLEFLHKDNLKQTMPYTQYKIEKCSLLRSLDDHKATNSTVVRIAAFMCPNIRELGIIVKKNKTIYALNKFEHLTSLHVKWKRKRKGDFQHGILPVLCKIGINLLSLNLKNFSNIDFGAITTTCPKLEELHVLDSTELKTCAYPLVKLTHLKILCWDILSHVNDCSKETWLSFLSFCPNITTLRIKNAEICNDGALSELLAIEGFCHLTNLTMWNTDLSVSGIVRLMSKLKNLIDIDITSLQVSHYDIVELINTVKANGGFQNYDFDMLAPDEIWAEDSENEESSDEDTDYTDAYPGTTSDEDSLDEFTEDEYIKDDDSDCVIIETAKQGLNVMMNNITANDIDDEDFKYQNFKRVVMEEEDIEDQDFLSYMDE